MHKDSIFPVSIEEFAAYLDGNLTIEDMNRVSSVIDSNSDMHSIANSVQLVDETLASYSPLELTLPDDISSMDFSIPQINNMDMLPTGFEEYHSVACCELHWFDSNEEFDDCAMTLNDETITEPNYIPDETECGHLDINNSDSFNESSQNQVNEY